MIFSLIAGFCKAIAWLISFGQGNARAESRFAKLVLRCRDHVAKCIPAEYHDEHSAQQLLGNSDARLEMAKDIMESIKQLEEKVDKWKQMKPSRRSFAAKSFEQFAEDIYEDLTRQVDALVAVEVIKQPDRYAGFSADGKALWMFFEGSFSVSNDDVALRTEEFCVDEGRMEQFMQSLLDEANAPKEDTNVANCQHLAKLASDYLSDPSRHRHAIVSAMDPNGDGNVSKLEFRAFSKKGVCRGVIEAISGALEHPDALPAPNKSAHYMQAPSYKPKTKVATQNENAEALPPSYNSSNPPMPAQQAQPSQKVAAPQQVASAAPAGGYLPPPPPSHERQYLPPPPPSYGQQGGQAGFSQAPVPQSAGYSQHPHYQHVAGVQPGYLPTPPPSHQGYPPPQQPYYPQQQQAQPPAPGVAPYPQYQQHQQQGVAPYPHYGQQHPQGGYLA